MLSETSERLGPPVKRLQIQLKYLVSFQYSGLISNLCDRAKHTVKAMDPTNELDYLRVSGKKHEILVAPDSDYILIVIQNNGE